jgi:hypothetical protein
MTLGNGLAGEKGSGELAATAMLLAATAIAGSVEVNMDTVRRECSTGSASVLTEGAAWKCEKICHAKMNTAAVHKKMNHLNSGKRGGGAGQLDFRRGMDARTSHDGESWLCGFGCRYLYKPALDVALSCVG